MALLGVYFLVALVAIVWVIRDTRATEVFELFRLHLHKIARELGCYRSWFLHCLRKTALLVSLVAIGIWAAVSTAQLNPFEFGAHGRTFCFRLMVFGSLSVFALPHLSVWVRRQRLLHRKATQLSELVSIVSSENGVLDRLEPGTFDAENGWTSWHPSEDYYFNDPVWDGLVPVVYLHRGAEPSFMVPIDFSYFLAWQLPEGTASPGRWLPIYPRCTVRKVRDFGRRKGWHVIRTELQEAGVLPSFVGVELPS